MHESDTPHRRAETRGIHSVYREVMNDARLRKLAVTMIATLELSVLAGGAKALAQEDTQEHRHETCEAAPCLDAMRDDDMYSSEALRVRGSWPDIEEPAGHNGTSSGTVPPTSTVEAAPAPAEEPVPSEIQEPAESASLTAQSVEADSLLSETEAAVEEILEDLPLRSLSFEQFRAAAIDMITRLPSLEELATALPESPMTADVESQLDHIAWLQQEAITTVEGYREFQVDMSRHHAFEDIPNYHKRIQPKMFIVHWTAMGYDDVDHFIRSLKPLRVQFFMDADARTYQLFEDDHHMPAHALGVNEFSQGVEIETGEYDGVHSPLFSYTPTQIEHTVYLAVDFLRRNNLPVDETTLLGHYGADMIFTNPYYDPNSGELNQNRVRKFDPPEELMRVIVAKAQALDQRLNQSR